jgi:predicted nuclease of predicted toxin-antitoxin system
VRFLVDENLSPAVVAWLVGLGHDAVHVRDIAPPGTTDDIVFARARAESRVLVTMDLDFGEIMARRGGTEIAVVLLRLRDTRTARVLARLGDGLAEIAAHTENVVVIVEDDRVRVRRLPIDV